MTVQKDPENSAPPVIRKPSWILGRLLLGMIAGNAAGALLCVLAYLAVVASPQSGVVVTVPSLLLIPLTIGLVAARVWVPLHLRVLSLLLHSLLCTVLAMGVGALVFREGAICLIILSPLLYGSLFAGAFLGRIWFRRDHVNLWLAPGLVVVVLAEIALRGPHHSVVVDEIQIAAPPSAVWPHVLAFEPIPSPPDYWLFKLGLPHPTETTNGGNHVGADRACRFSGDAVFRECIVEFEPLRRLTFDIVESPPDPELIGHLDAHRGEFELRDNGDGTTTLIGRTWYSLHVRPAIYFDWWTHKIFGEVHLRVMRNVKRLAEARP